jgi:hypothetical protein
VLICAARCPRNALQRPRPQTARRSGLGEAHAGAGAGAAVQGAGGPEGGARKVGGEFDEQLDRRAPGRRRSRPRRMGRRRSRTRRRRCLRSAGRGRNRRGSRGRSAGRRRPRAHPRRSGRRGRRPARAGTEAPRGTAAVNSFRWMLRRSMPRTAVPSVAAPWTKPTSTGPTVSSGSQLSHQRAQQATASIPAPSRFRRSTNLLFCALFARLPDDSRPDQTSPRRVFFTFVQSCSPVVSLQSHCLWCN